MFRQVSFDTWQYLCHSFIWLYYRVHFDLNLHNHHKQGDRALEAHTALGIGCQPENLCLLQFSVGGDCAESEGTERSDEDQDDRDAQLGQCYVSARVSHCDDGQQPGGCGACVHQSLCNQPISWYDWAMEVCTQVGVLLCNTPQDILINAHRHLLADSHPVSRQTYPKNIQPNRDNQYSDYLNNWSTKTSFLYWPS